MSKECSYHNAKSLGRYRQWENSKTYHKYVSLSPEKLPAQRVGNGLNQWSRDLVF